MQIELSAQQIDLIADLCRVDRAVLRFAKDAFRAPEEGVEPREFEVASLARHLRVAVQAEADKAAAAEKKAETA